MSDIIEVIDILNGDYTIVRHEDGCDLYRSKALPIAFKISVSEAYQLAERDQNNRSNMHLSEDGVAHTFTTPVLLFEIEGDIVSLIDEHITVKSIKWTTPASSFSDAKKQFQDRLKLEYGIDYKLDNFNIHVVPTPYL